MMGAPKLWWGASWGAGLTGNHVHLMTHGDQAHVGPRVRTVCVFKSYS